MWCQGFSEPNAGSDLASLRCTGRARRRRLRDQRPEDLDELRPRRRLLRDARAHRLRGAQAPRHHLADRADGRAPASTCARCATMEGTAEFCEVFFDDVRVPVVNRVGDENDGWRVANVTLSFERGTAFVSDVLQTKELVRDLAELAKKITSNGATRWEDAGLRRDLGQHRRRARRAVGADQAQHLAGAALRSRRCRRQRVQARVHRAAQPPRRPRHAPARPGVAVARRHRRHHGRRAHARGRFWALSMTIAAGTLAGAAQHRGRARARPARGTLRPWTSSSPTTRSTSRRACARSATAASRSTSCARSRRRRPARPGRWQELGETGVFSLRLPEADGGLGLGRLRGRARVRGARARAGARARSSPLTSRAGSIAEAATGEQIVGLVEPDEPVIMIEHLDDLDVLLVLADRRHPPRRPGRRRTAPVDRPLDPLTPVSRRDRRAARRRADRRRGRRGTLALVGAVLTAGLQLGIAGAPSSSRPSTRRSASSSAARSARSRRSSTSSPTCSCAPRWRAPRCTPPRARSTAAATTTPCGRRQRQDRWPATPRIANGKRASRCTAASGSRGRSTCSASGSAPCVLDTHFGTSDEHAEIVAATL